MTPHDARIASDRFGPWVAAPLQRIGLGPVQPGDGPMTWLIRMLVDAQRRCRLRNELQRLRETSDHLLADVGLDTAQADREIVRRFWQPSTVRRQ